MVFSRKNGMFYGFVSLLEGSISHLSTRIPSHNGSEEVQGSIDDVGMEFPQKISHKAQAGKTTKKTGVLCRRAWFPPKKMIE